MKKKNSYIKDGIAVANKVVSMVSEYTKADRSAWLGSSTTAKKPWGKERAWSGFSNLTGKVLEIEAGKRTSLKYHTMKNEAFYVMTGKVNFYYADEEWLHYTGVSMKCETLGPGDSVNVQSHCVYRIHAIENSEVIEISDASSLRSQSIRIEDDYGREVSDAIYPNSFSHFEGADK